MRITRPFIALFAILALVASLLGGRFTSQAAEDAFKDIHEIDSGAVDSEQPRTQGSQGVSGQRAQSPTGQTKPGGMTGRDKPSRNILKLHKD